MRNLLDFYMPRGWEKRFLDGVANTVYDVIKEYDRNCPFEYDNGEEQNERFDNKIKVDDDTINTMDTSVVNNYSRPENYDNTPLVVEPITAWEFDGNTYTWTVALPCNKSDCQVQLMDNTRVLVSYASHHESVKENSSHSFSIAGSMTENLPTDADPLTLSAKFSEDNFLYVKVNVKKEETNSPCRIITIE